MSELEKAVSEMLVKATSAAEAAGRFAVEQLPDIAQQYVTYIAIYSGFWTAVGVTTFVVFPLVGWFLTRHGDGNETAPAWFGPAFGAIAAMIFGGTMIGAHFEKFILAVFAPKVLLIQWAANLVK